MILNIKGRETFIDNHYIVAINEYEIELKFGYIF
jgi:hypothetical protein